GRCARLRSDVERRRDEREEINQRNGWTSGPDLIGFAIGPFFDTKITPRVSVAKNRWPRASRGSALAKYELTGSIVDPLHVLAARPVVITSGVASRASRMMYSLFTTPLTFRSGLMNPCGVP